MTGPNPSGPRVRLRELNGDGEAVEVAEVILQNGEAVTSHPVLMESWQKEGILGRPEFGVVFPQDGARFLEELPYMYRSVYFWAERAT